MRWLPPFVVAVGLTVIFWSVLWTGGGLIGGDLYPYFFPQKVFYAEQLAEGRIPLWNDRVGFGYPVLGESQTGALYPPNLLLYRFLDVNAAYNASQVAHYVLMFVAMFAFLRAVELRVAAALFGATVYTYGWFPARIGLEWAAIGGVYLPLGLWLIEGYRRSGSRRWLAGLAVALAMHLLAGHYNLAFIECIVWAVYAASLGVAKRSAADRFGVRGTASIFAALVLGFSLASIPLGDTFALKQVSQREDATDAPNFSPGYGHIPPAYLTQVAASWWWWYVEGFDTDAAIQKLTPAVDADTNKVEAHLYFGLVPLALAVLQLIRMVRDRGDRRAWALTGLGLFAVVYATGVLIPLTKHLPGFGYFMGPGRWGIVATFAAAYLASRALQRIVGSPIGRPETPPLQANTAAILAVVFGLTVWDLFVVSGRAVTGYYFFLEKNPPVDFLDQSPLKAVFEGLPQDDGPTRVYAPGQNVVSLFGAAQWPTYLGLGPDVYWTAMPPRPDGVEGMLYSDEQVEWLRRNAVGHVLSFNPLDAKRWGLRSVWVGVDPVLNGILARGQQPSFLYALPDTSPNVFAATGHCDPTDEPVTAVDWRPGRVSAKTNANAIHIRQVRLRYGPAHGWVGDSVVTCPDDPLTVGVSTNGPGTKSLVYWPGYWFVTIPLTILSLLLTAWLLWRPSSTLDANDAAKRA